MDFDFTVNLYQRNMKRSSLLSCQYDAIFLNMGKFWCSSFLEYVRRNFNALKVIAENRPAVELMLKTYLDEKGNFITTNPEDSILKKSSEDICMHSDSPRSYSNFETFQDFTNYAGLGMGIFDEKFKSLPLGTDSFKNKGYSESKQGIGCFSLDEEEQDIEQNLSISMASEEDDPALNMALEDANFEENHSQN